MLTNKLQTTLAAAMVFFICTHGTLISQNLKINEFLASNDSTIFDSDGDSSDWIELFNADENDVDLYGYFLSDDAEKPEKWEFPHVIIPAGGYLLIWASDKDRPDAAELHTNYKLSAGGEFIGIYAPEGAVLDSLSFGLQSTDVSFGRFPDGADTLQFLNTPTPGSANRSDGVAENYRITFSVPDGVFTGSIGVALQTIPPGGTIHYTTNGAEPTTASSVYSGELNLSRITLVRARVFKSGDPGSEVETRSYIVNDDPQLPVLTIATAPENLWDPQKGIYIQWDKHGDYWERTVQVTLIEDGEKKFSIPSGLRIHGRNSRQLPKKSFRLYFRSEYGESRLEYKLFDDLDIDEFKRLVLYCPSGDQPTGSEHFTLIHDALTHSLWNAEGGLTSAYRPVSLYLNNEYWGVYWIMERISRYYVEDHLDWEDSDLHDAYEVKEGDNDFWLETKRFFENNRMYYEENYQTAVGTYVDVENFTDYYIINIYGSNKGWPHDNLYRVRDRVGEDTRWKHIMWDTGPAWRFAYEYPMLEWATRSEVRTDIYYRDEPAWLWSSLILRKLLENRAYRDFFINRFADLMNTTMSPDSIIAHRDRLAAMVRPEVQRESDRWGGLGKARWETNLNIIANFANRRPSIQRQQIIDKFELPGTYTLQIDESQGQGTVRLNTLYLHQLPWKGKYYRSVPVTLCATPAPGYEFAGWSERSLGMDSLITLSPNGNYTISATFVKKAPLPQLISNVRLDSIAYNFARISWQIRYEGVSELHYGPDSTIDLTIIDSSLTIDHMLAISALKDSSLHFFRITAVDPNTGETVYFDSTFTTLLDREPPAITDIKIDSLRMDAAFLSWKTSEPCSTRVMTKRNGAMLQQIESDSLWRTQFSVHITDLEFESEYTALIEAWDRRGNKSKSEPVQFKTLADTTHIPPHFVSISVDSVTSDAAFISWETSFATAGEIFWGTDSTLASGAVLDSLKAQEHGIVLQGLASATIYYFMVQAKDSTGALVLSDTLSFQTLLPSTVAWQSASGTSLPEKFAVSQNFPNPFNVETRVQIDFPAAGEMTAILYDIRGREVRRLYAGGVQAGSVYLLWDGRDFTGRVVPTGIYLLQARFDRTNGKTRVAVIRMNILK